MKIAHDQGLPIRNYSRELRIEALRLVTEDGLLAQEAAMHLPLPQSTLKNWQQAYKAGKRERIGFIWRPLPEMKF